MSKLSCAMVLSVLMLVTACGPDTIFVRPGLDTPEQHVYNGHQLIRRGKLDDACREFRRAMELNPDFVRAHVGLGIALGRKGNIAEGRQAMDQAYQLSVSQQDRDAVQDGYRKICEMGCRNEASPKSP